MYPIFTELHRAKCIFLYKVTNSIYNSVAISVESDNCFNNVHTILLHILCNAKVRKTIFSNINIFMFD